MKMKIFVVCAIVVLLVFTSGCVEQEEVGVKTSLTGIRIGDMPTEDFSHINVTFSEIKLHKSGNNSGWVNFSMESISVDLIYLHLNNLTEKLAEMEIDVGNYTKLWITVDNVTGVLNATNETVYFDVPSKTLKIQQLFKIQEGNNTITVDIDLNSSILKYGGGEKYKLLPVISRLEHHHEHKLQFRENNKNKLKNMVENRPPVIDVVTNGSRGKPITASIGQNISFNATETFDIDGDSITYYWDFDDGTNATGLVVNHSYDKQGSYWVVLTASDNESDATETIEIHVTVKKQIG
ncbi:MAG: DUF4382 domain-containing protein [Thermoplasmatales archaeon]|nr:DUF4382 domain-containing protein [Thermoplasmatales archaeon]